MGQDTPHFKLDELPPLKEKVETMEILRQTNKSTAALAELNKSVSATLNAQNSSLNGNNIAH